MRTEYKQVLIVRKDLHMSHGKMAAQAAHASGAWLCSLIVSHAEKRADGDYDVKNIVIPEDLMETWFDGSYAKVILEAKNRNQLKKAMMLAEENGMEEGVDFFPVYDECRTELSPEEEDGTTLTCIGFAPMAPERIDPVGKKFHLYTEEKQRSER